MSSPPPYLSVQEIAKYLGVGQMTIYRLVHLGELRSIKIGNQYRVPLSAFREYLGDAEYQPGGAA